MLRVNLLPWRETYRIRRYRTWRALALAGIALEITLMLLYGWRFYQQRRLTEDRQTTAIAYQAALVAQAATVNGLKKDLQQAERLALQGQRRFDRSLHYAQLLQHLSQSIPQGVWVTQLHQSAGQLRVNGQAREYGEVLALSQALRHKDLLPQVQLREVKQLSASGLTFNLTAALATLEEP